MTPTQTDTGSDFGDVKRRQLLESVARDAPGKLGLFRRVFSGQASPRLAIKAKCLECCWMDERAIRECSAQACPCWGFRPYTPTG